MVDIEIAALLATEVGNEDFFNISCLLNGEALICIGDPHFMKRLHSWITFLPNKSCVTHHNTCSIGFSSKSQLFPQSFLFNLFLPQSTLNFMCCMTNL